ncbi:MAG: hypothetical protein DMD81_00120 [Candidatus Rokuibacteriota bacterium]|nr:MAG: hypothetical protein DMD81_00120 [Candidatus Rokubacteria bacterium]
MVTRFGLIFAVLLLAPTAASARNGNECSKLPASALRPRPCNPQAECLRLISKNVPEKERAARQRDCQNQPTSGTCYGPEAYNPQEECKKKR